MKINEMEAQVGITKGNIRYYEKEGLLTPGRNSENGYRDYSQEDVLLLKRIKLLRKLALPVEEIRKLAEGSLTVGDAARRHLITLERQRENIATLCALCQEIAQDGQQMEHLDAEQYLQKMARMEQEGTRFVNIKKHDTRAKYVGPIVAAAVFVALMALFIVFMVWAMGADPQNAPPWGLFAFLIALPVVIIIGVLLALFQRMKQIKGGEEDAAAQY